MSGNNPGYLEGKIMDQNPNCEKSNHNQNEKLSRRQQRFKKTGPTVRLTALTLGLIICVINLLIVFKDYDASSNENLLLFTLYQVGQGVFLAFFLWFYIKINTVIVPLALKLSVRFWKATKLSDEDASAMSHSGYYDSDGYFVSDLSVYQVRRVLITLAIVQIPLSLIAMGVYFLAFKIYPEHMRASLLYAVAYLVLFTSIVAFLFIWEICRLKGRTLFENKSVFLLVIPALLSFALMMYALATTPNNLISSEECKHKRTEDVGSLLPGEKTYGYEDGKQCFDCNTFLGANKYLAPTGAISSGFEYEMSDGENTCIITGMGSCTDEELIIPSVIDGYLVVGIYAGLNSNVVSVEIQEGVENIGWNILNDCPNLRTVSIPSSVKDIPSELFVNCPALESITVASENKWYLCVDGILYSKETGEILMVPNGIRGEIVLRDGISELPDLSYRTAVTSIVIPEGITSIGTNAFSGCASLKKVTLPSTITAIELGYGGAFNGCINLSEIVVNEGNKNYFSCSGILYNKADNTVAWIPENIEGELTFPSGTSEVAAHAFRFRAKITNVVIDGEISKIGCYAFDSCTSLTTATISAKVTFIDDSAFADCSALSDIYFLGTVEQWNAIEKYYTWDSGAGNYTVHCTDGNITK